MRKMAARGRRACGGIAVLVLSALLASAAVQGQVAADAQDGAARIAGETPAYTVSLDRASQLLVSLRPKGAAGFDFLPSDRLKERTGNGFYELGDLDLRVRTGDAGPWTGYSTALQREPVQALPVSGAEIAAADLGPTLPAGIPLDVRRSWSVEGGVLVLRYTLTNRGAAPVEIGALGMPMVFNNIITGRTLAEAHEQCSFYDPYIGEDAGYLQVTRLNGHGPALLVLPEGRTPFEAYRPILNPQRGEFGRLRGTPLPPQLFADSTPRSMTFEGFYEWMVASKAYAEDEWQHAQSPWNPSSEITLAPGASRTVGVRFVTAPSIEGIEATLAAQQRPVAVGVPGYIVAKDIEAKLFLRYHAPVRSITVEPIGALEIREVRSQAKGQQEYVLDGKQWGTARLSIVYKDGLVQTISYRVIKPERQVVADLGNFLTTKQWFVDPADLFHRSPAPLSYDREENRMVTEDPRVWIAGLSDEGGAGPYLAMAMKEAGEPDAAEVSKFASFVDTVLWGQIQPAAGPDAYGVRKSVFYYAPDTMPPGTYDPKLNWTTWTSWNEKQAHALDRSYNYPHAVAAYWAMYTLTRDHTGVQAGHAWDWYLEHAYQTAMAMTQDAPYYTRYGQMEGDIFLQVLRDLESEGRTSEADTLRAMLKAREAKWEHEAYPFGSEMPWDSTGQEEVYALTRYFGDDAKAEETVSAILGYDPAIPSWGYNGSARRYWDFLYGGKYQRLERQLHHYGSGINAIPLLAEYRSHPKDLYLLRVGYGGTMGELTNIDEEGFASAAFHAFPDRLQFDPLSGDYGSGFFGFAENTATYLAHDPELGWLSFGGNVTVRGRAVTVTALDAFRKRMYLAPVGLWMTLDAGQLVRAELDEKTGQVRVTLAPADAMTTVARLHVDAPAGGGRYVATGLEQERGAYVVPLTKNEVVVTLRQAAREE